MALAICEDAWNDKQFWERRRYSRDPIEELVQKGAEAIVSINASPWNIGKRKLREAIFHATAQRFGLPLVYVHMVGGNDQLVFDGSSFAMTAEGGGSSVGRTSLSQPIASHPASRISGMTRPRALCRSAARDARRIIWPLLS